MAYGNLGMVFLTMLGLAFGLFYVVKNMSKDD